MMKDRIVQEILAFAETSPLNRMTPTTRYFDTPLVGFASGNDPLWQTYKEVIDPSHRGPGEWLEAAFGPSSGKSCSVVSWILPITEETRQSQRQQKDIPCRQWALTRAFGEEFNSGLRRHLVEFLTRQGHKAISPFLHEQWQQIRVEQGPTSNWSERHAAHAAGLGTFSLNDGLITEKGIAHRCGSVVVDVEVPPTPRPYESHTEYCLYCREGKCGACIARCPVDAISRQGHDKNACEKFTYGDATEKLKQVYGVKITGCGLCQVGVPCERRIP